MSVKSQIVRQFRQPSGSLGRLAGWTMANRPSNRLRNERTLGLLELAPDDLVLEIGYGPGYAIALASRRLSSGRILGLDHSSVMYEQASRRNAAAIAAQRVELAIGDVLEPPLRLPTFDKIYSVNVVQFWPAPGRVFAELHRLLKPGGRIATTFMPRVGKDKRGQARARAGMLERMMDEAGFERRETHWITSDPDPAPAFCLIATK